MPYGGMPYGGNSVWVILGADGLSEAELKRLASTLNHNTEVVFVLPETSSEADVNLRFFAGSNEISFSSQGAVAAYYALSEEDILSLKEPETEIRQRTKTGVQIVRLRTKETRVTRVTMALAKPDFLTLDLNPVHIARLFGLTANELTNSGLPFGVISTGFYDLIVPLKSLNEVRNINPNFQLMDNFCTRLGIQGVTVFCREVFHLKDHAFMRHFAPSLGINEEPLSGGAAGNLGCYFIRNNLIQPKENFVRLIIEQGDLVNRSGRVYVHVEMTRDQILRVKVGGNAVMTFTGYVLAV